MRVLPLTIAVALFFAAGNVFADPDRNESGKNSRYESEKEREKERERAEKQREKAQKAREKEREKAEKQREKARKEREKRRSKREREDARDSERRDSYFHRNGYERLSIPKGHYPPPGMCRAWYPDRPAGHQPPPQRCDRPVPQGAWLIEHPRDRQGRVHVTAYEWPGYSGPAAPPRPVYGPPPIPREVRPRRWAGGPPILAIGEFELGTGILVRVIVQP